MFDNFVSTCTHNQSSRVAISHAHTHSLATILVYCVFHAKYTEYMRCICMQMYAFLFQRSLSIVCALAQMSSHFIRSFIVVHRFLHILYFQNSVCPHFGSSQPTSNTKQILITSIKLFNRQNMRFFVSFN